MFDETQFDKITKKAEKLEQILKRSETLGALKGIRVGIASLSESNKQTKALLDRIIMLEQATARIARSDAGITKRMYDRVKFYDKQNELINKTVAEINEQRAASRAASTEAISQTALEISKIERQIATRQKFQNNLAAEYELRRDVAGFDDAGVIDVAEQYGASLKKQLELKNKLASLEQVKTRLQDASAAKEVEINNKLDDQTKLREQLLALKEADNRVLSAQQKEAAKKFLNKEFGGGIVGQIRELGGALKAMGAGFAIFALIALALKAILGSYVNALKETIDQGLDASQRFSQIQKSRDVVGMGAAQWAALDLAEVQKQTGALSDKFGTLEISTDLILRASLLNRQLGLSADETSTILEYFVRIRGESAAAASNSALVLKATALANNANPARVMRDVAANAANFAKSGKASADEMGRAAILVRRLGTELSTISGIADRIVTDFEGTLEAQASIATFAPGIDMTGLMIASQFGTDEDIATQLKATVDSMGMNFDKMPRSFKLAISSGLGISVQELANIANATNEAMKVTSPGEDAMIKANNSALNELQQAVANPLDSISRAVMGIFSFLTTRWGRNAEEKVKGMNDQDLAKAAGSGYFVGRAGVKEMDRRSLERQIQDLSQIVPKTEEQKARVEKMKADAQKQLDALTGESRAVGGVVGKDSAPSVSLMSIFKNLKSNEVPTILHRGEAVLNKAQMGILTQMTSIQSKLSTSLTGFIGSLGKTMTGKGGILDKVGGIFNSAKSTGGIFGKLGGLLGSSKPAGILSGVLGGAGGGILKSITGALSGGGLGGIAKSVGSSLGLGKIGAIAGSVVPGLGTLLGGGLGSVLGSLATSGIGKAVTGLIGKVPGVGSVVKGVGSVVGKVGGFIGGLFGKKKKTPTPVQPDISQMAGDAGILNMLTSLGIPGLQQGFSIGSPIMGSATGMSANGGFSSTSTQGIEQKLDTLINLLRSGAIAVNMDGKKVSSSLIDANRYGT